MHNTENYTFDGMVYTTHHTIERNLMNTNNDYPFLVLGLIKTYVSGKRTPQPTWVRIAGAYNMDNVRDYIREQIEAEDGDSWLDFIVLAKHQSIKYKP